MGAEQECIEIAGDLRRRPIANAILGTHGRHTTIVLFTLCNTKEIDLECELR